MATQLFLRDEVADTHLGTDNLNLLSSAVGWASKALATTRGAGVIASDAVATVAGPTAGVTITKTSAVEWISPPISADVTISGTITLNIWASESNMSANVAINAVIYVIRANATTTRNSNTLEVIATTARTAEAAVTTRAVNNFTVTPTSTVVNRGDRLRVVIFGDDSTANMASGFTFNCSWSGTTGAADGDTFVTFTETFSFESAPAGSQLFLTNEQSGLTYGSTVPTLVSDFTGSDENPLSEGGNWANLNTTGVALKRISNAVASSTAGAGVSYWTAANFGPDLEMYCTVATVGAGISMIARIQGEGGADTWDGYQFLWNGTTLAIRVLTNAVATSLGTVTVSLASGDKIGARLQDSTLQLWKQASGSGDWNLMVGVVDTTYASAGKVAIGITGTTIRVDDFYAATDSNLFTADAPALISDFTGADEDPLSEGGNWATLSSSLQGLARVSNAVSRGAPVVVSSSYWTPANFGPDLEAYYTLSTFAGTNQLLVRIQGEGGANTYDGYAVEALAGSATIYLVTNGALTTLIAATVTWASGDKLGIRCEGSTIQLWRQASGGSDWNLLCTVVDTTYTSAGKLAIQTNNTSTRIDDFYAATDSNLFTQKAWTSRGAGVVSYRSDTDAGWVAPLYTTEWFTPQLSAFTLTGMAQANIRALELNASANASLRCEIARVDSDGTNATVWASWCCAPTGTDNGELTTSEVARTINLSGDDLAVSDGQRLRIRLYNEDISSAAMANAFNVQRFYNDTSAAASGDTYITFAQTIAELTEAAFVPRNSAHDHGSVTIS